MGYQLKLGQTDRVLMFLMLDNTDHITGKTGLTPTVTLSKNGAAFGAPSGAVSEVGSGWYSIAGDATDSDTLGSLILHAEDASADPCDDVFEVVSELSGLLATDSITNTVIQDGAISVGKFAANAIDSTVLADATITDTKVDAAYLAAIGTALSVDNTFLSGIQGYLDSNQIHVIASSLDTGSIVAASFASGAITASAFAANSITSTVVADNTITANKIATGAITAAKFAASAITSTVLATSCITSTQLAANSITSSQFADSTITSTKFAASAITASSIASLALTSVKFGTDVPFRNQSTLTAAGTNLTGVGSTTTDVQLNAGESAVDNIYTGMYLNISINSPAVRETRLITAYNGTTKIATVDTAYQGTPTSVATYLIYSPLGAMLGADSIDATNAPLLANLDATVSSRLPTSSYTAPPSAATIAALVLSSGDVDGYSLEETLKLCLSALAGKLSGAGTTTVTIRSADDSVNRIVATVDSDGNRTAITLDETG